MLEEKVSAIDRVHCGESKASIARDIGVPESTLRGWYKNENKLRDALVQQSGGQQQITISPASRSPTSSDSGSLLPLIVNDISDDDATRPTLQPPIKRLKIDNPTSSLNSNNVENAENLSNRIEQPPPPPPPPYDYTQVLLNTMAVNAFSDNSLLAQWRFAQNYLATAQQVAPSPAVGLVENGLQYTKAIINNNNNVINGQRFDISTAPPAHQDSTLNKSYPRDFAREYTRDYPRKSLSPMAHTPMAPLPPVKPTNGTIKRSTKSKLINKRIKSINPVNSRMNDWVDQQRQAMVGTQEPIDLSYLDPKQMSWFYRWYLYTLENPALLSVLGMTEKPKTVISLRRAILDCIMSDRHEQLARCMNLIDDSFITGSNIAGSSEEAIIHGEKFINYLDHNCRDPNVSRVKILQMKYMLDNMKKGYNLSGTTVKQSRK